MNIQNLVREKVVGNIKTGTKGEDGIPKKLPYFNVEEDKGTDSDMVDIFKRLYPGKPKELYIEFVSEDPFNFKFKRYVNGKAVCIGNDAKAITVGNDERGNKRQIEVECNSLCPHRLSGKCKLKGSLKFVLKGIEAGGVWNLSTSGGISLSNIASEIMKYKKAGMSIVGVPFKITLTPQESLAYGIYYSIDLKRMDIKPQLTGEVPQELDNSNLLQEGTKQITEGKKANVVADVSTLNQKEEKTKTKKEKIEKPKENENVDKTNAENQENTKTEGDKQEEDFSNYLTVEEISPITINNVNFQRVITVDSNSQEIEYILHPKANKELLECGAGTTIVILSSKIEIGKNVICKYEIKHKMPKQITENELNNEELKEAV